MFSHFFFTCCFHIGDSCVMAIYLVSRFHVPFDIERLQKVFYTYKKKLPYLVVLYRTAIVINHILPCFFSAALCSYASVICVLFFCRSSSSFPLKIVQQDVAMCSVVQILPQCWANDFEFLMFLQLKSFGK